MLRPSLPLACACVSFLQPQPARAADAHAVAIPRTTLDRALFTLARQTGADIVSTESGLDRIVVEPLSGRLSARQALDRLLARTPFVARAVDARSFRVVARRRRSQPRPLPAPVAPAPPPVEVVVTASKRDVALLRFPGSVTLLGLDAVGVRGGAAAAGALSDVAEVTPVLQSTQLGTGRNKLFIRGIADSSFNGPTQATASVYFGDVPIGYSGADPGLRLYDVARMEVLEGPQGTLYGAGAIGGVVRITPEPVDLSRNSGSAAAGVSATRDGSAGHDLDATVNRVLADGRAGLRGVAYHVRDGGYIDDAARGDRDVNRTTTDGGRLALALRPGAGWAVDLGALYQRIDARDAQYEDRDAGPLTRRSAFAQPYRSAVALGRAVATHDWASGLRLVSSTGWVRTHARDTFDATRNRPGSPPTIYTNEVEGSLLTHETRLTRQGTNGGGWLLGAAVLHARSEQSRALGAVGTPASIVGVTNRTTSLSGFAEGTLTLRPDLSLTAGARLTRSRTDGDPSAEARIASFVQGRTTVRIDPTLAASGLIAPGVAVYARYQSGFRTGGIAVARGVGRVADFRPDAIHVVETGLRTQPASPRAPALSAGLSFARWRDIQADLVDRRGLPFTANIGDARIVGVEASGRWSPVAGADASLSALYTANRVSGPLADLSQRRNRRLPETPAFSASATLRYRWTAPNRDIVTVGGDAHYVGRSVLGTGDYLDISQGRYVVAGVSSAWTRGRVTASLGIENIGNARGNRFALGNPFLLATRSQATPLVPARARLGLAVSW